MNKICFLTLILFAVTSCTTSSSYLTQSYTTQQTQHRVVEIQSVLEKPVIIPEPNELVEISENIMSKLEEKSYLSVVDLAVNNIIYEAKTYLGTPYRYGGTTRRGIDCSAFMQKIYHVEDINLPRVSARQAKIGIPVSRENLKKGDLIFFSTTSPNRVTHVGMVIEANEDIQFIHASSSQGVSVASLSNSYWNRKYRTARRLEKFVKDSLIPASEAKGMLAKN